MAIEAGRNLSYGSTTVTTKYRPLEGITYRATQTTEYGALLTNRIEQLKSANAFPQPLYLCTADWAGLFPDGVGNAPPLVVISTNRSKWIAAGVRLAEAQFKKKKYEGSNDLKALMGNVEDQKQSPPLYAPRRTEGDRKIFIMVHMHEYHQYATALAGLGLIVVGWSFKTRATAPAPLVGFGASRYAAIEFCKHMREKMGEVKKWDYAWLMDDNVVAITGFPGYTVVEEAMRTASATEEQVCSAFKGGSNIQGFFVTKGWAETENGATPSRGKPTTLPAPTTPPDIIQQAALWNIKYLADNNLNFAPLFVGSAEDVSIGNYFQAKIHVKAERRNQSIPYLFYTMKVIKEDVTNDDSRGSKMVGKARDDYARWFAKEESKATTAGRTGPPPVQIESTRTQTVSDFITTWFNETDPRRKPQVDGPRDPKVQDKAKCQAVEQAACGAIWDGEPERKQCYVAKDVLDKTFKVPVADGQSICQLPPPPPRRT